MEVDKTTVTYGSDDEMTPRENLDGRQFFGYVAIELVLAFIPFERVEFVTVQVVIAAQFGIMTGVNFQRNSSVDDPQGRRTCCQCPAKNNEISARVISAIFSDLLLWQRPLVGGHFSR